jgi:protein involved in polysaccharide export with SLBB domain
METPRPASSQDQQGQANGGDQQQSTEQQQAAQTSQSLLIPPASRAQARQQTIPEYYRDLTRSESTIDPDADRQARQSNDRVTQTDTLTQDLRKLVPSVNWRYAVIQRVNPATLKAELIAFDLGKAVIDGDASNNLALAPGDIVTVFSQKDITVPQQAQTRYVKVEGEVEHPGVYELNEGQTLQDALNAAGGLTAKAYPYGAHFTRESARVEQQKGLDEMIRTAEAEMRASTVNAVATSTQDSNAVTARQTAQQALLGSLRLLRASGRVVLAMKPDASAIADFPAIALEDDDKIVIPARTDTVTVSGAVYNPASFVYDARRKVGDYLQLAGKGGLNANQRHAFVLRADGSVFSRQEAGGLFHGGFDNLPMHPGDQIIVPEKVDNGVVRALHDWPQILAPLAVTALAIATVANQ